LLQRVYTARARGGDPPILIADEPTGNLDPELSHDILDLLDHVARAGTTVVVATHDPMVLENAPATRTVSLCQGSISGSQAGARALLRPPRSRPVPRLQALAPLPAEVGW
jgi:cell division transport system ATP-binding protein